MSLVITSNVSSLDAQNNFSRTSDALSKTLQRLSSGLKINTGADGPAALVISEQQRAQIAGLGTALDNASKAITLVQTAEGALNEVNSLLSKARSLALDAANSGVNDQNALNADQQELSNILGTIDNISKTTQFGQKKLLDGTAGLNFTSTATGYTVSGTPVNLPSGSYAINSATKAVKANVTAGTAVAGTANAEQGIISINGVNITIAAGSNLASIATTLNAQSSATGVTAAIGTGGSANKLILYNNNYGSSGALNVNFTDDAGGVSGAYTTGHFYSDLGFAGGAVTNAGTGVYTLSTYNAGVDAKLNLTDPTTGAVQSGLVTGTGNVVKFSGLSGGAAEYNGLTISLGDGANAYTSVGSTADSLTIYNNTLTFQIGANAGQTASVGFNSVATTSLGQNASGLTSPSTFTSLNKIKVNTTQNDAQDALRVIDKAIQDVTNQRGDIGAFQAITLQSTTNTLRTTLQNTTAAESTVRDTDFAAETANLAKYQVLTQAGAAVLSSSNQTTQLVLSLLQKLG